MSMRRFERLYLNAVSFLITHVEKAVNRRHHQGVHDSGVLFTGATANALR